MDQTWLQALQNGFIAAMTGGARGVLFILDPAFDKNAVANVVSNISGAQVPLPVLAVRYDVARDWLKQHSVDLDQARQSGVTTALGKASFFLRTAMAGTESTPPNVVGILEGSDPALKPLFKGDMKAQGRKLMGMISTAVNGLTNLPAIVPAVQDLGRRHVKYGVKDKDYDTVAGALVWTLGQGLGESFTPDVKEAWVTAYGVLAKTMKDAAATATV